MPAPLLRANRILRPYRTLTERISACYGANRCIVRFFEVAYEGRPTWDIGRPQGAVLRLLAAGLVVGEVLDVGCGTGANTIAIARAGHEVHGIDLARRAIERARRRLGDHPEVTASFEIADVLDAPALGRTFDTAIDIGLFHTLGDGDHPRYLRSLHAILRPGGRLVMLCWSDRNAWGFGPRRISRDELSAAFTEGWELRSIEAEGLESRLPQTPIHAWLAIAERR
jgi:cyclopropane fatty-acyl-phospholipid synthase-like methyltransferase